MKIPPVILDLFVSIPLYHSFFCPSILGRWQAFSEIELLQKHGINLREPYTKSIKGEKYKNLFELRVKFSSNISRIFYFTYKNNTFVLLNGFTKKSDETPKRELDKAIKYKEDYERRCKDE